MHRFLAMRQCCSHDMNYYSENLSIRKIRNWLNKGTFHDTWKCGARHVRFISDKNFGHKWACCARAIRCIVFTRAVSVFYNMFAYSWTSSLSSVRIITDLRGQGTTCAYRRVEHEKWLTRSANINVRLFLLSRARWWRCVAVSSPAIKLAVVKYGVLTSGLRYTGLSTREMRDPGRGRDDLVTLSRTATWQAFTGLLWYSRPIYTSCDGGRTRFLQPIFKYPWVPSAPTLSQIPEMARQPAWYPEILVRLSNFIKVSCGYHDHTANKVTR